MSAFRPAFPLVFLGVLAAVAARADSPPQTLQECAQLATDAERLACYDRLAGRKPAAPVAPAQPPAPSVQAPAPVVAAPARPAAPAAAAASAAPAAAASKNDFGLYEAEHPKVAINASETARIIAFGRAKNAHKTAALDADQLWEFLDDPDPLLVVGDAVTIQRASFGSFLLTTPSGRVHRVRRLR